MSELMLLGTRKGLLIFEQGGGDWRFVRECFKAQAVSYATLDARNHTLWAALDYGHWGTKLQRSRDLGVTWEEIAVPKYPEGAVINDLQADGSMGPQPAKLSYIWVIQPGGSDQPDRIYLGTEPGGLFQSDDGGDTFQLVESLWNRPERLTSWFGGGRDHAGVCSICVDPRDSNHVIIGISVGGVYETRDGGESWEARNKGLFANYLPDGYAEFGHDPHFIAMSPANPDVLWQQNHCGVFRSTDSGKQWQDISDPEGADRTVYFGFPVAPDEKDPLTAWVVPAIDAEFRVAVAQALCVCRTEDGGQTWTALRNGLPQEQTYDVVFRHALDIDGDRLAFGTTTGNLYLSDNRGDAWRSLGGNFPPVYSVRFASV